MTELSSTAQAVWDAFTEASTCAEVKLAAALRATAYGWRNEVGGITQTDFIRGVLRGAEALEEIADELEAQ